MLPRITTGSSEPVVAIDGRPGEDGGGAPLLTGYPAVDEHPAERRRTALALHALGDGGQRREAILVNGLGRLGLDRREAVDAKRRRFR